MYKNVQKYKKHVKMWTKIKNVKTVKNKQKNLKKNVKNHKTYNKHIKKILKKQCTQARWRA